MSSQTPTLSNTPPDLKSRLKASYDAIAPQYNTWTTPHSTIRLTYLSKLLSRLPSSTPTGPTTSILELGCGNGIPITQTLLSNPNISVTANDLSTAQISLARGNLQPHSSRLTLLEGDMLALTFPPSSFTAVLAFYSVIHLPREEQRILLRKIAEWLEPGGLFLANFSAEEEVGRTLEGWLGEEEGWMFWSGWGVEGTLGIIGECGLEVVESEVLVDVVDGVRFLWVLARKGP